MTMTLDLHTKTASFSLDASFSVPPGITVLFGPSGAGKSTCLANIAGIRTPDRGRITLDDDVWLDTEVGINKPIHARGVAFVFQSLALFPHMTGEANVAYGIDRRLDKAERLSRAHAMMERMHCKHVAARKPVTFSGGEAQRVALARAFAMGPRVLLLDEPFSALDRGLRGELAADVHRMVRELELPALLVTHHRGEARQLADRVVLIRGGRIEAQGAAGLVDGLDEAKEEPGSGAFDDTPLPLERALR